MQRFSGKTECDSFERTSAWLACIENRRKAVVPAKAGQVGRAQ